MVQRTMWHCALLPPLPSIFDLSAGAALKRFLLSQLGLDLGA